MNCLRVLRRAAASRMGQGGRQQHHTRGGGRKYVGFRCTMWARNAPDRHVVWPAYSYCTDLPTICFLQLLHRVQEISKTRNQF